MIRVGIGGWTYAPWRGVFFPQGLPHARELGYASSRITTLEINGTFYRTQKPESFRRWAAETPEGFVFSVKASRYAVNRSRLADAGPSIERFFDSGVLELGDKLGPVLWQLPPFKRFDEGDLAAFLEMLPHELAGRSIRHALEVRHESFRCEALVTLLRRYRIALVVAHSAKYPSMADLTGDFVYARLQCTREEEPAGYPPGELDRWSTRARTWESGGTPDDLPMITSSPCPAPSARDCFIYMISGAKVRAPAAAMALLERLQGEQPGHGSA